MKRSALLTLVLCAGMPVLAQSPNLTLTSASGESSVQLYGVLDLGVGKVDHSYTFSNSYSNSIDPRPQKYAVQSATGMFNGGISGSRLGLKGSTSLGEGWNAIAQVETSLNLQSGSVSNGVLSAAQNQVASGSKTPGEYNSDSANSGQLFSRMAFFGVSADRWGTLTAGRNTSFMLDSVGAFDAVGAQNFSPIAYSGTYGGGGETDNSRIDTSLKYRVKIDKFSIGLLHKFGGVTGSTSARGADQALLGYESGPFAMQLIYEAAKDAVSVTSLEVLTQTPVLVAGSTVGYTNVYTSTNQVAASFYDTKSYMVLARYQLSALALKGGFDRQEFSNASSPDSDATMTSIFGQSIGKVTVAPMTQTNGVATKKVLNVFWLTAGYDVTAKFNTAIGYYHVAQNDFSGGTSTPANKPGSGTFGSILLDYHFTKAFDTYAGCMTSQYRDGMASGFNYGSNKIVGLGARYMF